jgi:hypothetical protein
LVVVLAFRADLYSTVPYIGTISNNTNLALALFNEAAELDGPDTPPMLTEMQLFEGPAGGSGSTARLWSPGDPGRQRDYARKVESLLIAGIVVLVIALGAVVAITVVTIAWLRRLWLSLRQNPTLSWIARRAATAKQVLSYREALRLAPRRATELTFRVQRRAMALQEIAGELGPKERFRVEQTTRRYLPDTLNAFQMAVMGSDLEGRRVAQELLMAQLSQLEGNLDQIAVNAGERGIATLRANGIFIDSISAPPADDLQLPKPDS